MFNPSRQQESHVEDESKEEAKTPSSDSIEPEPVSSLAKTLENRKSYAI